MTSFEEMKEQFLSCEDLETLQETFYAYLGKKGELPAQFKTLKDLDPAQRKQKGQQLSTRQKDLQAIYEQQHTTLEDQQIQAKLQKDLVDTSIPASSLDRGHYNLLTKTRREIEEICEKMGFVVEYGHELVTKYENFEAVNIPLTHPATDMQDTIFARDTDTRGEELVFRTHTSSLQNAIMKKHNVPLYAVIPGKVYRYEKVDASHDTMFYQLEGMVIDKGISIAHAKKIMTDLITSVLGFEVKIRTRPGYFPFVEPGFEIDATCPICKGNGCSLCKGTGRIEILPGGMIHPNVLRQGGVDPEIYSGFAFGLGINRLVAIKYGIKDIRLFTNGDVRFAKSWR